MGTIAKPNQIKYKDAIIFTGVSAMLRVQNLGVSGGFDREEIKQIGTDQVIDYSEDLRTSLTLDTNCWGGIDGLAQLLARQPDDTPVVNHCDAQGGAAGEADDPANVITMKSFRDTRNRRVDVVIPIREGAYFQRSMLLRNQRIQSFTYTYAVDGPSTENYTLEGEGESLEFMGIYKDLRAVRATYVGTDHVQLEDTTLDLSNEGTDYLVLGASVNGTPFWQGGHYEFITSGSPANTVYADEDGADAAIFASGDNIRVYYTALQGGSAADLRQTWADVVEASHPTADSQLDIDSPGIGKITRGQVEIYYYNRHTPVFDDFADSDVTDVTSTTIFEGNTNLSSSNDVYNAFELLFISGVNAGVSRTVDDYVGATREITLSTALPAAPAEGDEFILSSNAVSPHEGRRLQEVSLAGDMGGEDLNELSEELPFATDFEDNVVGTLTVLESDLELMAKFSGRPTAQWTDYKDDTKNLFQPPGTEAAGFVQAGTSGAVFVGDGGFSAVDDHYNGMAVRFTSGDNEGLVRNVADYDGTGRIFTMEEAFPYTPSNDDHFVVLTDVLRAGALSLNDFFRSISGNPVDNFIIVYVYKDKRKTTTLKKITLPRCKLTAADPKSVSVGGRSALTYGFTSSDVYITSSIDGTVNSPFD